ncbi:NAD(P)/FAD-dependent oxidoreductase [Allobranchiibius huperziae]|uniref:Thioredoxin reductase n=1 Tax=Allobranchiibius huperziae TaxID=1874116 RepID=A0A853DBQ8_9MICO|nr:thioredoxin reductase [Allobranchiibius huperziae]
MTAAFDQTDVLDLVVVGGGAAGLSGAKIAARARRTVLLVDAGAPRNGPAEGVHNYLYAEGTAPARLGEIGRAEAAGYGVQIVNGTAVSAAVVPQSGAGGPRFTVTIDVQDCGTRTVSARRLLLATGVVDVLPDIAGLRERWGRDVLHCPFCHGWEVRDQAIGVIGSGPTALHAVQLFRTLTDDVVYFQHTAPDPTEEQLELLAALSVPHVVGSVERVETADDALTGVRLATGDVVAREALAVAPFVRGRGDLLADLDLRTSDLDMGGVSVGTYVPTDPTGLTGTPGVWAAGNLANLMAQVVTSASAGSAAGAAIHMDLMAEDSAAAVAAYRERSASRGSSDIPPQM